MTQFCGGCLAGLSSFTQAARQKVASKANAGLIDRAPFGEADEVPTLRRPRVGSWASPVPYSPLPWQSWRGAILKDLDGPDPDFELVGVDDQEATKAQQHTAKSPEDPFERRRRLRELEIEVQRMDSKYVSPGANRPGFASEQLFASPGSLPRPMSAEERVAAQHLLMSKALKSLPANLSTSERVARVPRRLVTLRGPHGQAFRRELLRGAVIVFFSAGYEGKRFIFEKAHELGVRTVLLESPDSWSRSLLDEGKIAKFIPIDMSQPSDVVFKQALDAVSQLQDDPEIGAPDGIASFVELSVQVAARLAETLGLPGPLPECVDLARDKHQTRAALAAAGLPTPPNHLVTCEDDLAVAARKVGFPAVLKPVSGAASLGVKKVNSADELASTYQELMNEMRSLVVSSGALVKNDGSGVGVAASGVIGVTFLLERYLDGCEVDVDIIMSEGEWAYAAVSDNGPTLEPYFNETWAVSPSLLPRLQQVALKELAIGSVKAMGFQDGIFHVECKYTSIGPHLIEVNARMGGGPVYETNRRCWGVDLVEETLFISVGIPSRPDVGREPKECIANSDINALRSGRIADLSFLEPLQNREGVISFSPHVKAGDEVVGPMDGLPTWLTELVVSRPTPREALDFLLSLEKEVQERVRLL